MVNPATAGDRWNLAAILGALWIGVFVVPTLVLMIVAATRSDERQNGLP